MVSMLDLRNRLENAAAAAAPSSAGAQRGRGGAAAEESNLPPALKGKPSDIWTDVIRAGDLVQDLTVDNEKQRYTADTAKNVDDIMTRAGPEGAWKIHTCMTAMFLRVHDRLKETTVEGFKCVVGMSDTELKAIASGAEVKNVNRLFKMHKKCKALSDSEIVECMMNLGYLGPGLGTFMMVGIVAKAIPAWGSMKTMRHMEIVADAYLKACKPRCVEAEVEVVERPAVRCQHCCYTYLSLSAACCFLFRKASHAFGSGRFVR